MDVDRGMLLKSSELKLLIDSLLESSTKYPLDILETDPYPSDLTLVQFAASVYTEKKPKETDVKYGERLGLPEGWRLLITGSNRDRANGYFGAAYVHAKSQQVVVAHRGTDPTSMGALYTDALGIWGNKYTSHMYSAVTFVELIRQVILSVNTEHGRSYNLVITGHSLGGWLGQLTAFTVKCLEVSDGELMKNTGSGIYAKAVVFDSPGAKYMLNKIRDIYYDRYGPNVLGKLNIKVYVLAPNGINTCGEHVGTVYRIFTDVSKFKWLHKTIGFYTLKTHAIDNFVVAFQKGSPNISEVLDWAKDSQEYKLLFGKEMLNNANNYHTDLGEEKEMGELCLYEKTNRYKVDAPGPQPGKGIIHFNAFSENELQVINQLIIIQKQTTVGVLNDFVSGKNFEMKNEKLFPNFEIDHNNRKIICESKQLLQKLTWRLKQLMRWLGPEFTEAVEQQIKALPRAVDLIYSREGQSYLDSLPKFSLNFTDSIGLWDFLLSPTLRVLWIVTQDGTLEMLRLRNLFFEIKHSASDPFSKYTNQNHYTFLDWPRLHKLDEIYGSPIDQNDLLMVDATSSSTIVSEIHTFLRKYLESSPPILKKIVFISTQPTCFPNSENILIFTPDREMNLMDLCNESQKVILQRKSAISTGNVGYSFQEFLGENFCINDLDKLVSWDCVKKIAINEDYAIILKDTRPLLTDLQMSLFKTHIETNMEHVLSCVNAPNTNTLVVMSGLSRNELETGPGWEKIILAEGDAELSFKDTCDKNPDKSVYLLEVSETGVHCKIIFNGGFYLPRMFNYRAHFDVGKFAKTKNADDLFVICSEEDKVCLLGLIECEKREAFAENVLIAATKEQEVDIIQKYFNKNIHFVKLCQSEERCEFEWRYSHGSVTNLHSCVSTDSFDPIDELTLSQTERSLVIITDEPGMGKTTSLATLSWLIKTEWVICIELKQFKEHIVRLSDDLTPQNVASFLLSECGSKADGNLVYGLLVHLLQSETCSKRVVIMFDGFDEADDYVKNKERSKDKLVKLFAFLHSKPTIRVFMTSRKYLKDSLEGKLNHFSTSFITINTQEQRDFLFMFWFSCLSLELRDSGEEVKGRLKEYAGEVLRQAKEVLGADMVRFMGIPLQLRMLAEVFRPKSDLLVQSLEDLCKQINIMSAPNLYERFVNLKHEIYLHDKTIKGKVLDDDEILDYLEPFTEDHGELGFRTFFTNFYDLNENYFKNISEGRLEKLNRIGLIQSNRNGDFQFIHRTYAEYFCAQMVVRWLNKQPSLNTYQLIKQILIPQLLVHPDYKTIRLFLNTELNEKPMSNIALESNAKYISQLWLEDSAIFMNQEHQTALHIAVEERNEHIVTLLLSGLNIESAQEAFTCFITQYDMESKPALDVVGMRSKDDNSEDDLLLKRIIAIFFRCVETCSNEIKEKVYFASFFNRKSDKVDPSNILVNLDFIIPNISVVFERLKEVYVESELFMEAVSANNIKLMKEILSDRLKNNMERYCLLLKKHRNYKRETAYQLAARCGHLDVVKLLAEQTSVPFAVLMAQNYYSFGNSPLYNAAKHGHLDIVKYLAEWGAGSDAKSNTNILKKYTPTYWNENYSSTVLHAAAEGGHLLIVKYLFKSGADIHAISNFSETALHAAARCGHLPMVEYLLKSGADIHAISNDADTALHAAALYGHLPIVVYLLKSGADVNAISTYSHTALHLAAEEGYLPIVKYLLKSGADIHAINGHGCTVLHAPAEQGHLPIVEYLLKRGVDVNAINNNSETALHASARFGYLPIVEYLLKSGADINAINKFSHTALHAVALQGHLPTVEFLLKSGADIHAIDVHSNTALHAAAEHGHLPIVEYLLKSGVDVNAINNDSETALHAAALRGHLAIVEYLLKSGADIHAINKYSETALHAAARRGHLPIVEYLHKSGVDVNAINRYSKTALCVAAEQGHLLVVETLTG